MLHTSLRAAERFRTGVSLHSHTLHSHENMDFLPRYAHRVPGLSHIIRRHEAAYEKHYGFPLDYARSWWTPPLTAADAEALERRQIEERLQLPALVSLTDHDSIAAPLQLHVLDPQSVAPVSVEWTVPLGASFVHLGIHNLPDSTWMAHFADFTASPEPARLAELMAALDAMPQVLIVVNHPLWDEDLAGQDVHRAMLLAFLDSYPVHALEINGLRPWAENEAVVALAAARNLPVISGGDRHGREPNATLNLSNAETFDGFVEEVRSGWSNVLMMPQYRRSLELRCLETMIDTLRDYPEYPGRVLWSDRIYFCQPAGEVATLTSLWKGAGPGIVRNFVNVLRVLEVSRFYADSVLHRLLPRG